jgi:hypothetical protein
MAAHPAVRPVWCAPVSRRTRWRETRAAEPGEFPASYKPVSAEPGKAMGRLSAASRRPRRPEPTTNRHGHSDARGRDASSSDRRGCRRAVRRCPRSAGGEWARSAHGSLMRTSTRRSAPTTRTVWLVASRHICRVVAALRGDHPIRTTLESTGRRQREPHRPRRGPRWAPSEERTSGADRAVKQPATQTAWREWRDRPGTHPTASSAAVGLRPAPRIRCRGARPAWRSTRREEPPPT